MLQPKPRKIILENEDGSRLESPFDALPTPLQHEILKQPFASRPSPDPEGEKFLLLEWDDGWKEVIEVDATCEGINRYYVISRPEDMGRLSINKEDGYPDLVEIVRKPLDLKRITFLDTFSLSGPRSSREGKKVDHFFDLNKEGDALEEALTAFRNAVREEGMDARALKDQDSEQSREAFERIRRRMDLKAGRRQQDVRDFIAYLARMSS